MQNPCENIKFYAHDKIEELRNSNKEKAFAICGNGNVTDIVEGNISNIHTGTYFEEFCKANDSYVEIDVHNHPSGIELPTIADMVNVAQEGGSNTWVCVVTKQSLTCVRPKGETKHIADELKGKSKYDEDFAKIYDEYAKELQPYDRWRSYDVVERNVEIVKCPFE